MDIGKVLQELREERKDLCGAILSLEKLAHLREPRRGRPPLRLKEVESHVNWNKRPKRRGRKFMGAEERAEVSKRMKLYWANRAKRAKERPGSSGAASNQS